ncbi:hypothetical protein cyc_03102 [Cyclospora cayetanensis]|uniref:Uncharacterized protein n=1 Tax=Cyclospora cayetanensis TaxID=88456 RepID=A0A1D3D470_9EIME|nr:hypothetical protein cyc_03102 [Cyclospora cayetanensis]
MPSASLSPSATISSASLSSFQVKLLHLFFPLTPREARDRPLLLGEGPLIPPEVSCPGGGSGCLRHCLFGKLKELGGVSKESIPENISLSPIVLPPGSP